MANAKKTVDAWKAKRDKAERALRKAVKRYNEAPDDSTQEQLTAIGKAMSAAQVRLQEVYDKLPYSLDDDAGEVAAQEWHDEMVAEVAIEQRKHLTSEQVAEVVNRYLANRHALVVVEYEKRFNRHEWEIQETVGYGIPNEHEPAHQEILGRIWVDDLSEAGEVIGVNFGYGLAKGELRILNQGRLAIIMRGVLRVIDKEFRLPDDEPVQKKGRKHGPSRYTDEEKIRAVHLWDRLDKGISAQTLEEFLDELFGNEAGTPNVSNSTFYGWRNKFRKHWE